MIRKSPAVFFFLLFSLIGFNCSTVYQSQALTYKTYSIDKTLPQDSAVQDFLSPYRQSVETRMSEVIGTAALTFDKKDGALGNFMSDVYLEMSREKYNIPVDIAFMNSGGIRIEQLPAGKVNVGKIYELMPFENRMIVQEVTGIVLKQLLDLMIPENFFLSGMTMEIKNKKAHNIMIAGKPINPSATYKILNSEFVVNGGYNITVLRDKPWLASSYFMRDALIDYIKKLDAQGKKITPNNEKRIINVD